MSIGTGAGKLAVAALIVAILLVPISLYAAVNLGKISENQQATAESIQRLSTQLNSTIADYQRAIEQLQQRLLKLENNITSLQAGMSQIAQLSSDLASLRAQVEVLAESLSRTNGSIRASLEAINETISQIEERLAEIQESASMMFPVTIVDGSGDEVVIPQRPERIVSLAPSASEALAFINATDRIVGVDSYTDWPPSLVERVNNGSVEVIGDFWNPDIEKILSLNPDLVVGVAGVPSHHQVKEILKAYGIPVILLPQETVDDIKESLIMLGEATGNIANATRAAADFEAKVLRITLAGQAVEEKRSVAIIVWPDNPMYVVGNGTFQSSGIQLIGAINAFSNLSGWPAVSPEQLLAAKPDVIILTSGNISQFLSLLNSTLGEESLEIPAVAQNRIYQLSYDISSLINRPSPRFALGLLLLQYIVYPEIYGYNVSSVPHVINELPQGLTFPEPPLP
ncbi:MAG: helical backbone metal receptor [Desulfurococcales archaeon]|nr:helical backbone metal receptor [Desulfurococcales archaeon]